MEVSHLDCLGRSHEMNLLFKEVPFGILPICLSRNCFRLYSHSPVTEIYQELNTIVQFYPKSFINFSLIFLVVFLIPYLIKTILTTISTFDYYLSSVTARLDPETAGAHLKCAGLYRHVWG